MGASAFLKSVDFRAFAVNVKTIEPVQKLYQSGHAIWCERSVGELITDLLLDCSYMYVYSYPGLRNSMEITYTLRVEDRTISEGRVAKDCTCRAGFLIFFSKMDAACLPISCTSMSTTVRGGSMSWDNG